MLLDQIIPSTPQLYIAEAVHVGRQEDILGRDLRILEILLELVDLVLLEAPGAVLADVILNRVVDLL